MSKQRQETGPPGTPQPDLGRQTQLAVLLMSFRGRNSARKSRKRFDATLRGRGDTVLDSTVVEVNAKHKAFGYDPHRVVPGTLVPALTWGLFGLVLGSDGWVSAIVWGVVGAICGGLFSYYSVTHLSKQAWAQIGTRAAANSSALALFVETTDVRALLMSTGGLSTTTASAARITNDLEAQVFAGSDMALEVPGRSRKADLVTDRATTLSMIMLRYPEPGTAKQVISKMAKPAKGTSPTLDIELMVERATSDELRVIDPKYGASAWAKSDLVSWGLFGVVVGLLSGLISGGLFGAVDSGITTGLIWAAFGLFAGALYGLWAGRTVTAKRLASARRLLPRGASMVLAWSDRPITESLLAPLVTSDSRRLVLHFNSVEGGVVLEAG